MKRALFAASTFLALPCLASLACSSALHETSGAHDDSVGSVHAALSATGPDGATYSVPTTASLLIEAADGSVTCDAIPSTPTQTLSLPVGTYTFYLSANGCTSSVPDAGANVAFTLDRVDSSGTTLVSALLVNPSQVVAVTAGASSSLVFQFTLEELGSVTMGAGNVGVSIATDASAASVAPTTGTASESFPSTPGWAPGSGPQGGLTSLFATSASGSIAVGISGLSAFTPNTNDTACATFTPTLSGGSSAGGVTAFMEELSTTGVTGTLCFYDQNNPEVQAANQTNMVLVSVQRTGLPITSTMQTALSAPAGATYTFGLQMSAWLTTSVDNGVTLSFAQFGAGAETLTSSGQSFYILQSGQSLGYLELTGGSTMSLAFAP
jgi:hypothetical protein